jgi:ankyrin repeat protein
VIFFPPAADTGEGKEVVVNLRQLRKQAKQLVRDARAGDPEAGARLGDLPVRLSSAQLVLARELGYASWPALVHALDATVESFVMASTSGRCDRARRLLNARPEIAKDRWARLVLGQGWDGDPTTPGGPCDWAPLLYVTHSCFASVDLASDLLARGADPNAAFQNEFGAMSALYGAAGRLHDPALTRVLLEAGADPNDGESLYHATEAPDGASLALLLAHGARGHAAAIAHAIDDDKSEHVRLLLDGGGDVNDPDWALLVHAVRRGCSAEMVRLLAAHGADLDRRGGEWSTPKEDQRTAYQNAVMRGREDLAAVLRELGASTEIEPGDLAVAALARDERPVQALPDKLTEDAQETLVQAVLQGRLDAVVDVYGPDLFAHHQGGPPGTLLHHACWYGNAEVVRQLLARGADPIARSGAEFDTPLAWAALGSGHNPLTGRDDVSVAEQLVAAGATIAPRFLDVAEGPLLEWLEDRSVR